MRAAYNNVGISPDSQPDAADFDGGGWSYSADQLAANGAKPGGTVTVDGIAHTWPNLPVGEPDNITASGQQINITGKGTRLQFLGAASDGNSSGNVTIKYTDGSTQQASIGFTDWTLGGGGGQPAYGNRIAVKTAYRNNTSGQPQQIGTDVLATAPITLATGKTIASVTLPTSVTGGTMHIFTIAFG